MWKQRDNDSDGADVKDKTQEQKVGIVRGLAYSVTLSGEGVCY